MTVILLGITSLVVYELISSGIFSKKSASSMSPISPEKVDVEIVGPVINGQDMIVYEKPLPRSQNEEDGIQFSYACWVLVEDYAYGTDTNNVIYMKGASLKDAPGPVVYIKKGSNALYVKQQLYNGVERIKIPNMPADKYFHLAVVVNQTAIDVYVNGILYVHKTLESLPLQDDSVFMIGPNGGWRGKLGSLYYYNYALTPQQVRAMSMIKIKPNPQLDPSSPPYFGTVWWTRSN